MNLTDLIKAAATANGAAGITSAQAMTLMPGRAPKTPATTLSRMSASGQLFGAGHHRERHYFVTKEWADAWHAEFSVAAIMERKRAAVLARKQARAERAASPQPLSPHFWTPEHTALMTAHYANKGAAYISHLTGRCQSAVWAKAIRMGIKCNVIARSMPKETTRARLTKPHKALRSIPVSTKAPLRKAGSSVRIEASPPKRGPAYLPGEPVTTAATRHVVYPTPPRALRTNTFSTY